MIQIDIDICSQYKAHTEAKLQQSFVCHLVLSLSVHFDETKVIKMSHFVYVLKWAWRISMNWHYTVPNYIDKTTFAIELWTIIFLIQLLPFEITTWQTNACISFHSLGHSRPSISNNVRPGTHAHIREVPRQLLAYYRFFCVLAGADYNNMQLINRIVWVYVKSLIVSVWEK